MKAEATVKLDLDKREREDLLNSIMYKATEEIASKAFHSRDIQAVVKAAKKTYKRNLMN